MNIRILLILFIILLCKVNSQQLDSNWIAITSNEVFDMVDDGENIWVAGFGIKIINKNSDSVTYINKFNSNFPFDYAYSIALDSNGNKWIGVKNGIIKYDNKDFIFYKNCFIGETLNEDWYVSAIAVDGNDNLFIGTTGNIFLNSYGIIKYNLKSTNISNIYLDSIVNKIYVLKINYGKLYIGTNNGLYIYDNVLTRITFKEEYGLQYNRIIDFNFDTKNNLWIAADYGLVHYYHQGYDTYYKSNSVLQVDILHDTVFIGGCNGLYFFDQGDFVKTDDSIFGSCISTLKNIDDQFQYVCSENGIFKYFNNGEIYNIKDQYSYITDPIVKALKLDKNGNIWIGSNGVIRYSNDKTDAFAFPLFLANTIETDNNKIWIGTESFGLYYFDGQHWFRWWDTYRLPSDWINSLLKDHRGRVWIGALYGLSYFENNQVFRYELDSIGYNIGHIMSIGCDNENKIWFASKNDGLFSYNYQKWERYLPPNFENGLFELTALVIDSNGVIWMGTENNGIYVFSNNTWQMFNVNNSNISSDKISCLAIDSLNNIWIGSKDNRLSKFDGYNWMNYDLNTIVLENIVNSIIVDNRNNKWIGTNKGLFIFNENGITKIDDKQEIISNNKITIFPNPASEYIEINLGADSRRQTYFDRLSMTDSRRELDIRIFNVYGEQMTVGVQNFEPLRIDVSGFPDGMYFLKLSESSELSESYRMYKFVVIK